MTHCTERISCKKRIKKKESNLQNWEKMNNLNEAGRALLKSVCRKRTVSISRTLTNENSKWKLLNNKRLCNNIIKMGIIPVSYMFICKESISG